MVQSLGPRLYLPLTARTCESVRSSQGEFSKKKGILTGVGPPGPFVWGRTESRFANNARVYIPLSGWFGRVDLPITRDTKLGKATIFFSFLEKKMKLY